MKEENELEQAKILFKRIYPEHDVVVDSIIPVNGKFVLKVTFSDGLFYFVIDLGSHSVSPSFSGYTEAEKTCLKGGKLNETY